jgi:hypothetical protein
MESFFARSGIPQLFRDRAFYRSLNGQGEIVLMKKTIGREQASWNY